MRMTVKIDGNIKPFTTSRAMKDLYYLGSIQRGYQIGALARTPEGKYLQVNGDITQELNSAQVERALKIAQSWFDAKKASAPKVEQVVQTQVVPKVIIKPRRRVFERV